MLPTYLRPSAQGILLETPADCLEAIEKSVNWEAELLYGVQGQGQFDEFLIGVDRQECLSHLAARYARPKVRQAFLPVERASLTRHAVERKISLGCGGSFCAWKRTSLPLRKVRQAFLPVDSLPLPSPPPIPLCNSRYPAVTFRIGT
jgi:hypothetical protein